MTDLKIFGEHDENTVKQMWACMGVGSVEKGVLCADGHVGYAQPVGGVVAYEKHISVSGVGFDIGCGNMAMKLDMTRDDIRGHEDSIYKDIQNKLSFGVGLNNKQKSVEHELYESDLWDEGDVRHMKPQATLQLGTIGGGNHYVDLFEDPDGHVWIGVHFGSRGLGHKTATKYLKLAGGKDGMFVAPAILDVDTDLGRAYIAAMKLAGWYAMAGREWVVDQVRRIMAAKALDVVHNHHNFAWLEEHSGKKLWVVRKGATPSAPGERGFVGGSMGDDAVIIRGLDTQENREALYSSIHGAGRLFGRAAAKKTFTRSQMKKWTDEKGISVFGGDVDESPMAYRRLPDVLGYHNKTLVVETVLKPFAVFMAGQSESDRDPYKD
jgi:tRNA-splicing ligase RtcB